MEIKKYKNIRIIKLQKKMDNKIKKIKLGKLNIEATKDL